MVQQIVENPDEDDEKKDKKIIPLDADDIALLKTYGVGPYGTLIKKSRNRFSLVRLESG